MIEFQSPYLLYLIIPFSFLIVWILIQTRTSVLWINANVSERFTNVFTSLQKSYKLYFYFLLVYTSGVLLILAFADPVISGKEEEIKSSGEFMIIIDASQSMWAGDTIDHPITKKKPYDRFSQSIEVAQDFIDLYPNYFYGVMSFSNEAVILTPPQKDITLAKTIIQSIKIHRFEWSGSSYKKIFQKLIDLLSKSDSKDIQILLISDGEIVTREKENYLEELETLKNFGVRIHAIGIGTKKGGSIRYFLHYYDIQNEENEHSKNDDSTGEKKVYRKEETIKSITTKREDRDLKNITSFTKGKYIILENHEYVDEFKNYLKFKDGKVIRKKSSTENKSISRFLIGASSILFIIYSFILFRKKKYIYEN
ncbi:MAG: VWA domain-containing protein [Leptospiraceae bacterium]|nr:VWA domain-containing protein [Leptospiraceae bacterium]MCK6380732.1 VWA domain-containing protein [Leptospiraceae bacterium]NUM40287.1 VWA domain-containing protein [Leptospiraceae bacterium]